MLLTGFQERMISKRRQVSIPLNVKSTAEGQTHTSARQPGLKRGRSKRQVISHMTAENSLHRFHILAAMTGRRQCVKPLVVSLLGRKSGGGLELPVKAPAGQRAGVLVVTEVQSLSVKSVDVICLLL